MNNNIKKWTFVACVLLMAVGCKDSLGVDDQTQTPQPFPTENTSPDKFSIKLRSDIAAEINNEARRLSVPTGSEELDDYLRKVGASSISRVFPYAGRDEMRQRAAGLNLWYTVYLDKNTESITRAMHTAESSAVATFIEPVYIPKLESYRMKRVDEASLTRTASSADFNDPLYSRQWDFRNDGTIGNYVNSAGKEIVSSIAGADINVEPAWKITTGSPDVVVAVVDGGIDLTHPDLQGSLWVNEKEIPGNGIDDDNNGFVDDYYGYNFVDDTCAILPTRHGTHVAGTIAARNNNDRGVCGIAGGNGQVNTGVKVMSCMIFKDNPDYDETDPNSEESIGTGDRNLDAAAIVYGANNGAVISQNSWGFGLNTNYTPQVIKEAIDYFIANAGGSHTKRPLMKGGVVIFASGNDQSDTPTYPSAEENVISVGAFNPDYQASWYTNYGESVDISAPGGTQMIYGKYPEEDGLPTSAVLSTVPPDVNGRYGYAYLQGTSMACPHVSGIAALVVSHFGGPQFTADELRQRLLSATKGIDYNDYVDDSYKDGMGLGYIDALAALSDYDRDIVPVDPVFIEDSVNVGYVNVGVCWQSANKGSDGSLQYYKLYYSLSPITKDNYKEVPFHRVNANFATAGQIFRRTNNRAKSATTYYFAVQAVARNGNESGVTIMSHGITTLKNNPPVITSSVSSRRVTLAGNDQTDVVFHISDPENLECSYSISNGSQLTVTTDNNDIKVHIDASKYIPGIYPFKLTVKDQYGAQSTMDFVVEIVADRIPVLKDGTKDIHVALNGTVRLNLTDYVDDERPEKLKFSVVNSSHVALTTDGSQIAVKGTSWGEGWIDIEATDVHGQTGKFRLKVFVYSNPGIYALYPTVVTSTLYLKIGDAVEGEGVINIRNSAGKRVRHQSFNTRNLDSEKRTLLIGVSSLAKGSYTLTLTCGGKSYEERFVKE